MKLSETTERGVDVFIFVFGNISVIYTFTLLALLAYYCILLLFALHICIACFFLSLLFFFVKHLLSLPQGLHRHIKP